MWKGLIKIEGKSTIRYIHLPLDPLTPFCVLHFLQRESVILVRGLSCQIYFFVMYYYTLYDAQGPMCNANITYAIGKNRGCCTFANLYKIRPIVCFDAVFFFFFFLLFWSFLPFVLIFTWQSGQRWIPASLCFDVEK